MRLFKCAKQFALNRGTKSADLAQSPGFDGPTKVIEGAHFKLVIKQLDTLRSESGKSRHFAKLAGEFLFQSVQQIEVPGLDDVGDFTGQILADPRQLRQITSGRQQPSNPFWETFDDACGATIGAHSKLVLSLNLQQFRGLIEHCRDFGILH